MALTGMVVGGGVVGAGEAMRGVAGARMAARLPYPLPAADQGVRRIGRLGIEDAAQLVRDASGQHGLD